MQIQKIPDRQARVANQPLSTARAARALPKLGTRKPAPAAVTAVKIGLPALTCALLWTQVWIGILPSIALALVVGAGALTLASKAPQFGTPASFLRRVSFGETIWLNRLVHPVASSRNHQIAVLYGTYLAGFAAAMAGSLWSLALLTGTGLLIAYTAQVVYFQKVATLYEVMKTDVPQYRFWTAVPDNDNG